jgi:hypothetical protein
MGLFDKEEVVAPTMEAAVAEAVKAVVPAAPVNSGSACTRDTRGDAPCAVKNCENCN